MKEMKFNHGFDIRPTTQPIGYTYGPNVFGPQPQLVKEVWENFVPLKYQKKWKEDTF